MSQSAHPGRESTPAAPSEPVAPLKPRKGLFIAACAVFAMWVAFLLALYFTTVRGRIDPHHHHDDHAAAAAQWVLTDDLA